jgi:ribosomal protein S18
MTNKEENLVFEKTQQELQKIIDEWVEKKKGNKMTFFTKKENEKYISWKSIPMLRKYMTRFGDIKPRKYTGNPVGVQKNLRKVIIRAREM